MRLFFFVLFGIAAATAVHGQGVSFLWAKEFGNTQSGIIPNSIGVDGSGNIYTAGFFSGTVDFDPGSAVFDLTAVVTSVFISKSDSNGNFAWAKQINGPATAVFIAVDAAGNVFATGTFSGITDFDPGAAVFDLDGGAGSAFVVKINAAGNFVWARQVIGGGIGGSRPILADAAGNIYTTGYFSGTADFDPGPGSFNLTAAGGDDVFVLKLDAGGDFVWAKQMGGPGEDKGNSIAKDGTGNIYTIGDFDVTADFDPGAAVFNLNASSAVGNCFVSKLDAGGNFVWARQTGGSSAGGSFLSANTSIAVDDAGSVYLSGSFVGPVDFDPGPGVVELNTPGQYNNIFVARWDAAGNFIWAKQMAGPGAGNATAIALDAAGNVYTTGYFTQTVDFNPGTGINERTAQLVGDVFISELDANGDFVSVEQMPGSANSTAVSMVVDGPGNIYTTGYFIGGTVDFDPGTGVVNLTADNEKMFVQKIGHCTNILLPPVTASACGSFSWKNQTYSASGDYADTLTLAGGCLSIETLELTIFPEHHIFIDSTICPGQVFEGHSSSGIYKNTYQTINGCDSERTVTLTVLPEIKPSLGKDTAICAGDGLILSPGQFISYLWQDGSNESQYTATKAGLYSVTVSNQCGSASTEIRISGKTCGMFFPTAFTPNQDGRNELFKIINAPYLTNYALSVYNRWGERVFETRDYGTGWNGRVNGQPQETGVYVWFCKYRKAGATGDLTMKGTVLLIR